MKIAITVWGNRISPVFDAAQTLLVAEIRKAEIVSRNIRRFQAGMYSRFIKLLVELEVEVLICGALWDEPATLLEASGVEVIPFITGDTEAVLSFWAKGMDLMEYRMPGCPYCCCRRRS